MAWPLGPITVFRNAERMQEVFSPVQWRVPRTLVEERGRLGGLVAGYRQQGNPANRRGCLTPPILRRDPRAARTATLRRMREPASGEHCPCGPGHRGSHQGLDGRLRVAQRSQPRPFAPASLSPAGWIMEGLSGTPPKTSPASGRARQGAIPQSDDSCTVARVRVPGDQSQGAARSPASGAGADDPTRWAGGHGLCLQAIPPSRPPALQILFLHWPNQIRASSDRSSRGAERGEEGGTLSTSSLSNGQPRLAISVYMNVWLHPTRPLPLAAPD